MSTRTTASDFTNASDAQFRTWGKWFRDCFSAAGWTLETEVFGTGTNWTDVTAPSAANQARVTVIFTMADALQATVPLFVKLEIGSAGAAGTPGWRLGLGTGRSGTTLTGSLLDTGATFLTATATTQLMTHYSSGDTNRINIQMCHSGTSWTVAQAAMCITLERRKNGSGVDQGTGWLLSYGATGATIIQSRGFLATAAGPAALSARMFPTFNAAVAFDGKTPVSPMLINLGPAEMGLEVVAAILAEFPAGTTFNVTILGSSHTYIMSQIGGTALDGGLSSCRIAFRYE